MDNEPKHMTATEVRYKTENFLKQHQPIKDAMVRAVMDRIAMMANPAYIVPSGEASEPSPLPWTVTPWWLRMIGKPTFRKKNIWHPLARKGLFHWPGHRWEYTKWPGPKN